MLFHLLLLRDVWSCKSVALGLVKNHRDAARELKAGRWKGGYLVCLGGPPPFPSTVSPKAAKLFSDKSHRENAD